MKPARQDRIRLLIDNSSLDPILDWPPEARMRFEEGIRDRRFVVYLAPETVAEMFLIGTTARADRLQPLADLTLRILNGRVLNHYLWRIFAEVSYRHTGPYMPEGLKRRILEIIEHFAKGRPVPAEWFKIFHQLVNASKDDDRRWRDIYQEMYRNRDRRVEPNPRGRALEEFVGSVTVRDLELGRVREICTQAGVGNPGLRASELLERTFAGCPTLKANVRVRVARLWWYTESSRDGQHVDSDLFDDALLIYLAELDGLVTNDKGLRRFGEPIFPDKRFLTPDSFREECLNGG